MTTPAKPESTNAQDLSDLSPEDRSIEPQPQVGPWLRLVLVMTVPVLLLLVGISLTR